MNKSKKYILSFVCILFGLLLFFSCIHAARQTQPLSDTLGQTYDLHNDYLITQYADATGQHGTFYTIENSESLIIQVKNKSVKQITIKESNLYFCGIPSPLC